MLLARCGAVSPATTGGRPEREVPGASPGEDLGPACGQEWPGCQGLLFVGSEMWLCRCPERAGGRGSPCGTQGLPVLLCPGSLPAVAGGGGEAPVRAGAAAAEERGGGPGPPGGEGGLEEAAEVPPEKQRPGDICVPVCEGE